jgi:hypothetical protein|tara:strand:- start:3618 stop:5444 length:1827 start_codon:yes stop_codon:yes gene_type:complete
MVKTPFKHSFATQMLRDSKFKLFADGKQILKYKLETYPRWKIEPIQTRIKIGRLLFEGDPTQTRSLMDYEDLLRYNVMVSRRKPTVQMFHGQKKEYFLTKRTSYKPDVGTIPEGHSIERKTASGEIRLVGKNSTGRWFNASPRRNRGTYYEGKSIFDNTQYNHRATMKRYLRLPDEDRFSEPIEEIVLGISEDGRLICLQEERENPTTGFLGKKRHGKSLCKHRKQDNQYWKWGKKIIELNDISMETDSYCQTWKPIKKFSNLDLIYEHSLPLPIVYLHPTTRTLKYLIAPQETGFQTYISFKDFILDFNNVLKGKEDWVFKNAGVYFRNLLYDSEGNLNKDGLAFCKNYKQIEAVVLNNLIQKGDTEQDKQRKIPEGVIPKVLNVLKDIDNAKILDISNGKRAKWTVQFPDGHKEQHYPWTACLIADLVPVVVTDNIKNSHPDIHPQSSNFILNDLFRNQSENPYFRDNNIELFISFDEILSLVHSPVAVDTFKMVIRESGHKRIGFDYCTQSWGEIPEFIQSQTDYIIAFQQKRSWAKEICGDFGALKHKEKEMVNLQKGEFIIFSSNPIILIDEYGKKESIAGEAIKGTIFPSLSAHKAPKAMGA